MTRLHVPAALLAAATAATLLAACGSDADTDSPAKSGTATAGSSTAPAPAAAKGAPGSPCEVTDQGTVASVFSGAGAGRPGAVRNCEYKIASGPVSAVNVYLYEDTTLEEFSKQDKDNGITFTPVKLGDGAIRDQLHTLTVQQGDTLFSVQALPRNGLSAADYAKNDPQLLALATKIVAGL